MLGRTFKMAFWVYYDHLGKLVLASAVWSVSWFLPFLLGVGLIRVSNTFGGLLIASGCFFLSLGVLFPTVSAGMACMVKEFIDTRDGSLATMLQGSIMYFRKAIGLGILYLLLSGVLVTSVWFYAAKLGARIPLVGYTISAFALWCEIFLLMTSLVVFPALVQKRSGLFEAFKLAILLSLDNLFSLAAIFLSIVVFGILSLLLPPIFVFLYGGVMGVLTGSYYELLSRKYAALEAHVDSARGTSAQNRRSRARLTREELALIYNDAQDDYLNRGFRDFLFPWKG